MRVTVINNHLNIRVGKPRLNAPTYQYLAPGSEIEVDGMEYKGDSYKGINTWLRDGANNYYWGGGVTDNINKLRPAAEISNVKFNYNELIDIPKDIKSSKGQGVTIAVIDSGSTNHLSFGTAIARSYDVFTKKEGVFQDSSATGHGTFISGIIASRGNNNGEIIGIAPMANIIAIKAVDGTDVLAHNILSALQWIESLEADKQPQVINLSLEFNPGNLKKELEETYKRLNDKNMTIIAAGQNEAEIFSSSIFYPASSISVLGVGALTLAGNPDDNVNKEINYVVPNDQFYSSRFSNSYQRLDGCSISTAIVSATFALFMSYKKQNSIAGDIKSFVNKTLPVLKNNTSPDILTIYRT